MKITQVVYLQKTKETGKDYFEPCCGLELENGDLLCLDDGAIIPAQYVGKNLAEEHLYFFIIHRFYDWVDMDCSFCNYETLLNYRDGYLDNKNKNTTEDDETKDIMDCLKLMADVVVSKDRVQTADDAITLLDKLEQACELVKKHDNEQED